MLFFFVVLFLVLFLFGCAAKKEQIDLSSIPSEEIARHLLDHREMKLMPYQDKIFFCMKLPEESPTEPACIYFQSPKIKGREANSD